MANEKNLRAPTTEEAREIGRKGGIASGVARRVKKTGIELGEYLLQGRVKNAKEIADLQEKMEDAEGVELTQEVAIVVNMIQMAKTNPVAFEKLMKYLGRYVEKQAVDVDLGEKIKQMTPEQARDYLASLNG